MLEITRQSAGRLASLMRSGTIKSVDVMRAFCDRIERYNSKVNALVQLDLDGAMRQAEQADALQEAGKATGLLHGVPTAIKDIFDTKGFRTTFGAAALRDNSVDEDHLHVRRLKNAGAIIVGKTNTPEFAFGQDCSNKLFGRTKNPYDLSRTPGSSSGGAGAALALDLVALTDGSDLGGSTRIPASWCNIAGMRPSVGAIPIIPTSAPFDRLSVVGPMARNVDDLRIATKVMTGAHPEYPYAPPFGKDRLHSPLKSDLTGRRIALNLSAFPYRVRPEVSAALEPVGEAFRQAGGDVQEADPNIAFIARSQDVFRSICAADTAGWAVDEHGLELDFPILDLVAESRRMDGYKIERARMAQAKAWQRAMTFFKEFDLYAWPTTSQGPFIPNTPEADAMDWATVSVSPALNLPTISVPAGFLENGLPVGLQIAGPPGSDRLVMEAAKAIEDGLGAWAKKRPNLD